MSANLAAAAAALGLLARRHCEVSTASRSSNSCCCCCCEWYFCAAAVYCHLRCCCGSTTCCYCSCWPQKALPLMMKHQCEGSNRRVRAVAAGRGWASRQRLTTRRDQINLLNQLCQRLGSRACCATEASCGSEVKGVVMV